MRTSFGVVLLVALFVVTSGAWAGNIPIADNDFTNPTCGAGAGSGANCQPAAGTWTVTGSAGQNAYSPSQYLTPPDASTQVGWANSQGSLEETVGTLAANEIYVLSVEVGSRVNTPPSVTGPVIELIVNGVVAGTATGTIPAAGDWSLYTLTINSASLSSEVGDSVQVFLGSSTTQTGFSDAELNASPEPAMFALVGVGLLGLVTRRRFAK